MFAASSVDPVISRRSWYAFLILPLSTDYKCIPLLMLASCKLILGVLVLVRAIIIDFHAVIISKRGNTVIVMHSLVSFVCISLRA